MTTAEVPRELAAMPAGPELAAALDALALPDVANDRLLEVLAAQYRQLCRDQARLMAVLIEISRAGVPAAAGEVARTERPDRYAPAETRSALRWTRHAADTEHDLAESVIHGMPLLFQAWLAGSVDRPRVRIFDQYLTGLAAEQIERVCTVAVPRAPKLTTGQLARLLQRMVIAVDPDAAARWYRHGIRDRNVTAYPAPDGTITVSANGLPADEAEAACERIQLLAAAAKRAGHPGRIGQIRCDLFLGLLDGRFHAMSSPQVIAALIAGYCPTGPAAGPTPDGDAPDAGSGDAGSGRGSGGSSGGGSDTGSGKGDAPATRPPGDPETGNPGPGDAAGSTGASDPDGGSAPDPGGVGGPRDQRVGIEIRIGLATVIGLDEHPGEIPGLGLLIAPDARHRVASQSRSEWRFAVTDADGALVSEGRIDRRPAGIGRAGPHSGIVELHVSAELLAALAVDLPACGEWAPVVVQIAARHARRDDHLADLDAQPGARRPGAALRRHTEIRDRTCTFAGVCRHPARAGDIDHTREHAGGGPTTQVNLGPLCDHDHDVKHRAGWTLGQPEPGLFIWRSPLGGTYISRGEILLPELPEPVEPDPEPRSDAPPRTDDGPILRRPPPPAPDPPPTPPREYPDEPPF